MRVAVFVVLVLVASTPSEASKSCMTKTDARQHFGSVHIYWHGKGHCWDATPIRRHHQTHKVQKIHNVQRTIDQPKWYESMSQMLPDEVTVKTPWVDRWVEIEPTQRPIVNIVQIASPAVIEPRPERMLTPRGVMMAFIAIALTLAIVELVFGRMRPVGRTYQRN